MQEDRDAAPQQPPAIAGATGADRHAGLLGRLGAFCARHPWPVIAAWLVVMLGTVAAANRAGRLTTDAVTIPGSDSQAALDLGAGAFPHDPTATQRLLVQAPSGRLTEPAYASALDATAARLRSIPQVSGVALPSDAGGRTSADGRSGFIGINLTVPSRNIDGALADTIMAATQPATDAGLQVTPGDAIARAQEPLETRRSEIAGLIAALVILTVTFGTVAAALVPIGVAAVGLALSLALIGLLGHVYDVPSAGPTIASMIGLGVGIDYALFLSSRYRERLRLGLHSVEAVAAATATSGRAVVFAGSSVVVALCSLLLVNLPILRALGVTAAIAVVVAVIAAITALPAVLGLLGRRALRRSERDAAPSEARANTSQGWLRLGQAVATHPIRWLLPTLGLLLLLALPALDLSLGTPDAGSWPQGTAVRTGYDRVAAAFGPGENGPLLVTVQLATARDPRTGAVGPDLSTLEPLSQALTHEPGVAAVTGPQLSQDHGIARWNVTPDSPPSSAQTVDLVHRLRSGALDSASKPAPAGSPPPATTGWLGRAAAAPTTVAHVGGATAARIDLGARLAAALPVVVGVVVLLSALLLLLAFRAPVVALKAAVMNLISVLAAYGVLTMVFTWGWGAGILGLQAPVPIEAYVPILLFAVLFGLSMDYEVFLLSAVQEEWRAGRPTREAVAVGLGRTGTVITSAALVMVIVFASFTVLADPVVKMFGVGLAAAVAIDATIVRGILVPATMALLDDINWWLPHWLDRLLPQLHVEGHD